MQDRRADFLGMFPELATRPELLAYLDSEERPNKSFRRKLFRWLAVLDKTARLQDNGLARTLFDTYYRKVVLEKLRESENLVPDMVFSECWGFLRNRKINLERKYFDRYPKRRVTKSYYVLT